MGLEKRGRVRRVYDKAKKESGKSDVDFGKDLVAETMMSLIAPATMPMKMLKAKGVSQFLVQALKKGNLYSWVGTQKGAEETRKVFKGTASLIPELLKVPQGEFKRIKDLVPYADPQSLGQFFTKSKRLGLAPEKLRTSKGAADTVWHEFTHARQFDPKTGEGEASAIMRYLGDQLEPLFTEKAFYRLVDPLEIQARSVGKGMQGALSKYGDELDPAKAFDEMFTHYLKGATTKALGTAEGVRRTKPLSDMANALLDRWIAKGRTEIP